MAADRKRSSDKVALVQSHQLTTLQRHMSKLEEHTSDLQSETAHQSEALLDLDAKMSALLSASDLPRPSNNELEEVRIAEELQVSELEAVAIRQQLPDLSLGLALPDVEAEWDSYLREVEQYIQINDIDLTRDPLEQLIQPHRAGEIFRKFHQDFGPSPWDRWDYGVIAAAVIAGTLLDYFIVATPLGRTFKGKTQRASPLTAWMREKSKLPLIQKLEKWAKATGKADVSYDLRMGRGNTAELPNVLSARNHRLSSLGHDPIFGLLYGTIDILRNTCTFVDDQGKLRAIGNTDTAVAPFEIPAAIVKVILHYLSDAFTPAGLPAPFLAQFQRIQAKSGFTLKKHGNAVSVSDLTRHMYRNGYDVRHFLTMATVPAFAELVIRTYHGVRVYNEDMAEGKESIRGRLKLSKMLLVTHGLLSSTNILKTALYRWDPTALNLNQFLVLAKNMLSLLRLSQERNSLIAKELEDGYKGLLREYGGKASS